MSQTRFRGIILEIGHASKRYSTQMADEKDGKAIMRMQHSNEQNENDTTVLQIGAFPVGLDLHK